MTWDPSPAERHAARDAAHNMAVALYRLAPHLAVAADDALGKLAARPSLAEWAAEHAGRTAWTAHLAYAPSAPPRLTLSGTWAAAPRVLTVRERGAVYLGGARRSTVDVATLAVAPSGLAYVGATSWQVFLYAVAA